MSAFWVVSEVDILEYLDEFQRVIRERPGMSYDMVTSRAEACCLKMTRDIAHSLRRV